MTWILIAYLIGLLYLATHREKLPIGASLRTPWIWFALVPIIQFVFSLIMAGNVGSAFALARVQIWSDGISWLLLGISLLCLTGSLAPNRQANAEPGGAANAAPPHR
jgi:hypothetical protein